MGLLLYVVSFSLSIISILGIAFSFIQFLLTLDYKRFNTYFMNMAISIDQYGNVAMSPIFNAILIKKHSVNKFGNVDETISSVLGKNQQKGTLARIGRGLNNILMWLDKNHSVKSIEQE